MSLHRYIREYRAAQRALNDLYARQGRRGIRHETPAYWRANERVHRAIRRLPPLVRFLVS